MDNSMVVTIGREYGSGGREIGRRLAEKMNVPFYDKEILTRAAKESGICKDLFEQYDEKATPSYLFSLSAGMDAASIGMGMPLNHRIFLAQFEAIGKIAAEGPCIIVGRCADYVLKDHPAVVKVFLYADVENRVQRIMRVEGLDEDKARDAVRKTDKNRQRYYNFFADGNWGRRKNYDLMMCTDGFSEDSAAEALLGYVKARETK